MSTLLYQLRADGIGIDGRPRTLYTWAAWPTPGRAESHVGGFRAWLTDPARADRLQDHPDLKITVVTTRDDRAEEN